VEGEGRRFFGIVRVRRREPGEDQVSHMQLFDIASEGGEEGGLARRRRKRPRRRSGEPHPIGRSS
jgi:hypothetical protein